MAVFNFRLENSPIFGVATIVLSILAIPDDSIRNAVIGAVGALIGQVVFIGHRAKKDTTGTVKFADWEDAFVAFGWMLVGGFFSLVMSLPEVPKTIIGVPIPLITFICTLFVPKLWDVLEKDLPEILQSYLMRFATKRGQRQEQRDYDERERESAATTKETDTVTKGKGNEQ